MKIGKVEISSKEKLLFKNPDYSKLDIVNYYKKIWKYLKNYISDYPITLQRFPKGIEEDGFYQKNISDYFPDWIEGIKVKGADDNITHYPLCNDLDTLLYLVNQGTITFHSWLSKKDNLDKPDKIIFDLDPPDDKTTSLVDAAYDIKDNLEKLDLTPFVMTTGSTGLHIIVPIEAEYNFEQVKEYAKKIAHYIISKNPEKYSIEQRKNKREGKIFIDILRNARGQTGVCPYSLRPKSKAPIATPLNWEELEREGFDSQKYNISNIFRRLGQIDDPWKNFNSSKQSIKNSIDNLKKLS